MINVFSFCKLAKEDKRLGIQTPALSISRVIRTQLLHLTQYYLQLCEILLCLCYLEVYQKGVTITINCVIRYLDNLSS